MTPVTAPHARPQRRRPAAFGLLALLLLAVPLLAACSQEASSSKAPAGSDPVIARVNGVDITQGDLALAEEDVGAEMQAATPEAKRER